jgi:hypothetical protein
LNLETGAVDSAPWGQRLPDSIYPAYDGGLLIFSDGKPGIIRTSGSPAGSAYQLLDIGIPRISQLAVSTDLPLAAWKDSSENTLNIADFSGSGRIYSMKPGGLPEKPIWSMDWAGTKLVLAYPGELVVLSPLETEQIPPVRITDNRLPERWYRLRGGSDRLVVQFPETGILGIILPENLPKNGLPEGPEINDFAGLLEYYTLSAGDSLEDSGNQKQAEIFYRWALPYIRENRSLHPLEEIWPALESELTTRRMKLRN